MKHIFQSRAAIFSPVYRSDLHLEQGKAPTQSPKVRKAPVTCGGKARSSKLQRCHALAACGVINAQSCPAASVAFQPRPCHGVPVYRAPPYFHLGVLSCEAHEAPMTAPTPVYLPPWRRAKLQQHPSRTALREAARPKRPIATSAREGS